MELRHVLPATPVVDLTLARARQGDLDAFRQLYQAHVGRVYAVVLRMCADAGMADEVTQDTFVKAWQRLDGFRADAAFGTWLHRLAVNTAIDKLRREKRFAAPPVSGVQPPRSGDRRVDLERAIASLPSKARQVFVLHDLEGFKHDEIASLMGITSGTSRGQLHRARALLREALS